MKSVFRTGWQDDQDLQDCGISRGGAERRGNLELRTGDPPTRFAATA